MAERLLDELLGKVNQITASLDANIAQLTKMNDAINQMSQKFSEETVSLTENIRLIVEVLKQFRVKSAKTIQDLSDNFNAKIKDLREKQCIETITNEEKKAINMIKKASQTVANNLYYAQLLNIIQSIREETNKVLSISSQSQAPSSE